MSCMRNGGCLILGKYNRDEIIKRVTEQLDRCLAAENAQIYNWKDRIVGLEEGDGEGTVIIKFNYYIVEEDDYIGLGAY